MFDALFVIIAAVVFVGVPALAVTYFIRRSAMRAAMLRRVEELTKGHDQ